VDEILDPSCVEYTLYIEIKILGWMWRVLVGSGPVLEETWKCVCHTDWVIVLAGMIDMVVVIVEGEDMVGEVQ